MQALIEIRITVLCNTCSSTLHTSSDRHTQTEQAVPPKLNKCTKIIQPNDTDHCPLYLHQRPETWDRRRWHILYSLFHHRVNTNADDLFAFLLCHHQGYNKRQRSVCHLFFCHRWVDTTDTFTTCRRLQDVFWTRYYHYDGLSSYIGS